MQYEKHADGRFTPLARQNVDTGLGLERVLAILQGVPSAYETELFVPIIEETKSLAQAEPNTFALRVIADHTRAATFVLAEGITPGNVDQPYIARRLIRRTVRYGREIGIQGHFMGDLAQTVIDTMAGAYPELKQQRAHILSALDAEETRFQRTLRRGEREFHRAVKLCTSEGQTRIPGQVVFRLYDTYGFPPELTAELAAQAGLTADMDGYQRAFQEHQEKSRQGAAGRFKGGLAERAPETVKLHTATHLLHQALRQVLGPHVEQRGSNITTERLRFDFAHPAKLTPKEVAEIERIVNEQIERNLPVTSQELSLDEARESGAIGLFEDRYGDRVRVFTIGDATTGDDVFSREICGGPHVEQTGDLDHFRIAKQQSIGSGMRRIRAVLEPWPGE
jgi:alanyl-tRNA synthetase